MKSSEFLIEADLVYNLSKVATNELSGFIKWGLAQDDDIVRYRAAVRLANRSNSGTISDRGIRDYKKLRGLAISMAGLESMHLDREV